MNYADWSPKLEQVLQNVDSKELFTFMVSYARQNEALALELINEFRKPEKEDYRAWVEQCFMHPAMSGIRSGESYDWSAIGKDLSVVMSEAEKLQKDGNLLSAADIARYVLTMTCEEYEKDHPYGEVYGEAWALRRKLLRSAVGKALEMLTELLIIGEGIDEDSQRGLMKEIVAECKPWKKTHVCNMGKFLEDAQEKVLSEKQYITWLNKKLSSTIGGYFKREYLTKKVRFLQKHHGKEAADEAMRKEIKEPELRSLYIDWLIEEKDYEKALAVMDDVDSEDFPMRSLMPTMTTLRQGYTLRGRCTPVWWISASDSRTMRKRIWRSMPNICHPMTSDVLLQTS